jgi:16S rRNA (guanine1207-N2)-methyltransferase
MQHYFIDKQHNKEDYFKYTAEFNGKKYVFNSVDSMFSKDGLDEGTRVLLNTVVKLYELNGDVLDLGCGIGSIGVILKNEFPNTKIDMVDINKTAMTLARQNCALNNAGDNTVFESSLYDNIDKKYDFIVTNPPIKVGKEILFGVVTGAIKHLKDNGEIILVIRKNHGQESMKKHMEKVFGNAEILKRDKGYYIMKSTKKDA